MTRAVLGIKAIAHFDNAKNLNFAVFHEHSIHFLLATDLLFSFFLLSRFPLVRALLQVAVQVCAEFLEASIGTLGRFQVHLA